MFFFKDAQCIIYATTRKYFAKNLMHKKGQNRMALPLNIFFCKSVLVCGSHARSYELTLGLRPLGIAVPEVADHRYEDVGDHKEEHNTGVQSNTYIVAPVPHRALH